MRELRIIGLDEDGRTVVCEDTDTHERFTIPADDRLRAAADGDLETLGRAARRAPSHLTPREIQDRIRSGASVEEVAAEAEVPRTRIEVFAHPVLLERARFAELARASHPIRVDGPTVETLEEIVDAVFASRGLPPEAGEWDAWKSRAGHWVVRLSWTAGHTHNAAHWRLQVDGHGGVTRPLDEAAEYLLDPDVRRPLQPLPTMTRSASAPEDDAITSTRGLVSASAPRSVPAPAPAPLDPPAPEEPPADTAEDDSGDGFLRHTDPDDGRPRTGRKPKPAMPSWEDVLLGVRSRHGE